MGNTFDCHGGPGRILPPLPSEAFENIEVVLASNSPRRRELLGLILPSFSIAPSLDIDETYPSTLPAAQVPAYLSQLKAETYKSILKDNQLIITADTVVILDGAILGKPKDCQDAIDMLHRMCGNTHTVVTGVTMTSFQGKKNVTFSTHTDVTFCKLNDEQIEEYVSRFQPFDKAGAYGIQEWIGAAAIENINGSFYNVMGLPLHALYQQLREFF